MELGDLRRNLGEVNYLKLTSHFDRLFGRYLNVGVYRNEYGGMKVFVDAGGVVEARILSLVPWRLMRQEKSNQPDYDVTRI